MREREREMLASHRVLLVMTLTATDRASDSKMRREKNKNGMH